MIQHELQKRVRVAKVLTSPVESRVSEGRVLPCSSDVALRKPTFVMFALCSCDDHMGHDMQGWKRMRYGQKMLETFLL